jgi:ubiquinone/menaquinone biosynthesis C-methylase UbiE
MMRRTKRPFYGLVALVSSTLVTVIIFALGILVSVFYSLLLGLIIILIGLYSLFTYLIPIYYINPFKSIDLSHMLTLRGSEVVLDVGCGLGRATNGAAKLLTTGKVIGVDIWDTFEIPGNSPERAYRNSEIEGVRDRVEFRYGDAFQLPFDDEFFDVVICSGLLTSFRRDHEKLKSIKEMKRVLKTNGTFLMREPINKLRTFLVLSPSIFLIRMPSKSHWMDLLQQSDFRTIEYFPHRIAGSFKTVKS